MRIHVVAEEGIRREARVYAEYRLFAALSQLLVTDHVRNARVVLRHARRSGRCHRVSCTVTVVLDGARTVRIRTTGSHAFAAINRAIDQLRETSRPRMNAGTSVEQAAQ
jgi:ribosome-associated translation inhibitor RaiA